MKHNKEKPTSLLAAYIIKNYPLGTKKLHIVTGIPYTQLSREINDQLELSLEHFLLIALAVNPQNINNMAADIFKYDTELTEEILSEEVITIKEHNISEFGKFLALHSFSKKELASISDYAINTLNNLSKQDSETNSKLIAVKFHRLCMELERDFYSWTLRFYPNTRLKTEEEQKILEENFYKDYPLEGDE